MKGRERKRDEGEDMRERKTVEKERAREKRYERDMYPSRDLLIALLPALWAYAYQSFDVRLAVVPPASPLLYVIP